MNADYRQFTLPQYFAVLEEWMERQEDGGRPSRPDPGDMTELKAFVAAHTRH